MPLVVVVHPDDRLITANGRDKVSIRDIEDYLDATMAGDRLGYAKLVDFSDCRLALSESDVLSLGAWIQAYGSSGIRLGPIAIVVRSKDRPIARLYEMLATADRQIRLFSNALSARTWLDKMNGTG
jgi:hypothetical protein